MRGTNQGGSLIGFIIVGVLLALVLIGGLYGLNRYNAQRAADQIAASEEESTDTAADDRQRTTTESESAPAKDETPSTTPAPADPGNATGSSNGSSQPAQAATTAKLPQTGPADTAFALIVLGAVTFAATHYVRSRS